MPFRTESKTAKCCPLLLFLCVAVLYSLAAFVLFRLTVATVLRNVLVQTLLTFLPGYVFLLSLSKGNETLLMTVFLSYALGYMINIVTYFLLMPFGLRNALLPFSVGLSLLSAICLFFKNNGATPPPHTPAKNRTYGIADRKEWIVAAAFCVFLVFSVFGYAANNLSPAQCGTALLSRDLQYWVTNTNALAIKFPAEILFFQGSSLYYHYFSSIQLAFQSIVGHLDTFTLSFPLYPLTTALLTVGSFYYLLTFQKVSTKVLTFALFIALFTTGAERYSVVTYLHHILIAPFGYNIGHAFGAFFVGALLRLCNQTEYDSGLFVAMLLFFAGCVGAKGPIAVVLIVIPAVFCFAWLVRKQWKKALGYGIPIVMIFLCIGIFCEGLGNIWNNQDSLWSLCLHPMDKVLCLKTIERIILANPLMLLQYLVMLIVLIHSLLHFGPRPIHPLLLPSLFCSATVGILLWITVDAGGSSEMYFCMAAYIPTLASIPYTMDWLAATFPQTGKQTAHQKVACIAANVLVLSLAVFGTYLFQFHGYGGLGATRSSFNNAKQIARVELLGRQLNGDISNSDYTALAWIRDHTEITSVVAVDRATVENLPGFYYYGVFCARQLYLEGTNMLSSQGATGQEVLRRQALIRSVYVDNSTEALKQLREEGVEYLVQTLSVSPNFSPDPTLAKLAFRSETIHVYTLQ